MKTLQKKLVIMAFLFASCGEENPKVTDPRKALLGRWEEVENSLGPVNSPSQYEEYLPDSVLLIYRYSGKDLIHYKYWFSDSLLYKGGIFIDAFNDTVKVAEPYTYKFLSYNKLRMDFQNPALVNWYIYKRIK